MPIEKAVDNKQAQKKPVVATSKTPAVTAAKVVPKPAPKVVHAESDEVTLNEAEKTEIASLILEQSHKEANTAKVLPVSNEAEQEESKEELPFKQCPECLSEIPIEAKRCAHCGQIVISESK